LEIANCSFANFFAIKSENIIIGGFIQISLLGGNVFIDNLELLNSSFVDGIIQYDSVSFIDEEVKLVPEINSYLSIFNGLSNFSINISHVFIQNGVSIYLNLTLQPFFFFDSLKGILVFSHFSFNEIFCMNFTDNFLFFDLRNLIITLEFQEIYLLNITDSQIFYTENVQLIIEIFFIENYFINEGSVLYFQSSNISFDLVNFYNFSSNNSLLITCVSCDFNQTNSQFENISSLGQLFSNSFLNINTSNYLEFSMNAQNFFYEGSSIFYSNSNFYQIQDFSSLFYFDKCSQVEFESSTFLEMSGTSFLFSGSSFSLLSINNCTLKNFDQLDYVFDSGMMLDILVSMNSLYENFNLKSGFLQMIYPSILQFSHNQILNQTFYDPDAYIFLFLNMGDALIVDCFFNNILFFVSGRFVFEVDSGQITIINSTFLNNGWAYMVIPAQISNIEYNSMFYFWSDFFVAIYNCTFLNEGELSLFSGFIETSVEADNVIIDSSSFEASDKRADYHYHGVLLQAAEKVLVSNSLFIGLECSNYNSYIHNNGVLSLQGESTYIKKTNEKNSSLINNTFQLCQCQYGGSLAIINYNQIILENTFIFNSYSTKKAGAIFLVSITYFFIKDIYVSDCGSYSGSAMILQTIIQGEIINALFNNTIGETSGTILIDTSLLVKFSNFMSSQTISNQNGGFLILKGGELFLNNSIFYLSEANNFGGAIYLNNNGILHMNNVTGYDCTSLSMGGFLYLDLCNYAEIYNLNLKNITSFLKGAAIFIDTVQNFLGENWSIEDCSVPNNGIIHITNSEKLAFVNLNDIFAKNNKAITGSFFYGEAYINLNISNLICENHINNTFFFMWIFPIQIYLINASFSNGISQGDVMFFYGINVILMNLQLYDYCNNANVISIDTAPLAEIHNFILKNNTLFSILAENIFLITTSNCLLDNILLIYPNQTSFYFLYGENSQISLDTIYLNSMNGQNTSLIYLESSEISLNNSIFSNNIGPILLIYDTNCSIISSFFLNNLQSNNFEAANVISNIKYTQSNIFFSIFNSTFYTFEGSCITFYNLFSIVLNKCLFIGNKSSMGVILNEFNIFLLNSSIFSQFVGDKGSALIMDCTYAKYANSTVQILNSSFNDNVANFGGAIFMIGINDIWIISSNFFNNQAIETKIANKYGIGGVLIIEGTNNMQCSNYISDCEFLNNSAEKFISSVFSTCYLNVQNVLIDNNLYNSKNNNSNLSSIIFSTFQSISNFPLKMLPYTLNDDKVNYQNEIVIVPGLSFNLTFLLLDEFNQILLQVNQFYGRLLQIKNNTSDSQVSLKNSDSLTTSNGFLTFQNFLIKAAPNSSFFLQLNVEVTDFDSSIYQFQQNFQFYSRPCQIGEIYNINSDECLECPMGYYSIIDPMNPDFQNQNCIECDSNAICPGKFYLIPDTEYWRMDNESLLLIACPLSMACLGSRDFDTVEQIYDMIEKNGSYFDEEGIDLIHGTCLQGHHKNLCNDCETGYGKFNSNTACQKCEDITILLFLRLFLTFFFLTGYLLLNAKLFSENDSQIIDIVSKIFFNHLQKINIVVFFNINDLIPSFQLFMSVLNTMSFLNEDIIVNDCFLQNMGYPLDDVYIYKILSSLVFPFLSSMLPLAILVVSYVYQRKFKPIHFSDPFILNKISLMILISTFLFYPLIMKCSLNILNCIQLKINEQYLYMSPNVKCWDSTHFKFLFVIGVFGIFGWGFAFPMIIWLYLRKKFTRNSAERYCIRAASIGSKSKSVTVMEDDSVIFLKFFYKDYKNNYYYWESVIFFQKFALSVILYCNQLLEQEFIDLIFLSILLFYLAVFEKLHPYKIKQMNHLEFCSLVIAILTKILIVIQTDAKMNNSEIQVLFSVLVIVINSFFFATAGYYIVKMTKWRKLYYGTMKKMSNIAKIINKTLDIKLLVPSKIKLSPLSAKPEKKIIGELLV